MGLDAVCITEHNVCWDMGGTERLVQEHGFPVFAGVEATTSCGEVLVFGVHEPLLDFFDIEALRRRVVDLGGVIIAAHPFRSQLSSYVGFEGYSAVPSFEKACDREVFRWVDAVEVLNARSSRFEQQFTQRVIDRLHLKGTGGSDAHSALGVGRCYTAFSRPILSEGDLVAELRAGNFTAEMNGRFYPL